MSIASMAQKVGIHPATLHRWKLAGCPLDTADGIQHWAASHVRKTNRRGPRAGKRRMATTALPSVPSLQSSTIPMSVPVPDGDTSLEAVMGRVSSIELLAFQHVAQAIQGGGTTLDVVATYRDSIRALIALRGDLADLKIREGNLVPIDEVRRLLRENDETILAAIRTMPKQLSAILSPHDPSVAERVLADWTARVMAQVVKCHAKH